MTYSVARTESAFDQKDKSSAQAVGLMQVTPEAGRDTAKRFGVSYDWGPHGVRSRLQHPDEAQAELSALVSEYKGLGDHDLRPGYNAGRGPGARLGQGLWRSPRSQCRSRGLGRSASRSRKRANYVQRVMENMKVYHMRFEGDATSSVSRQQRRRARTCPRGSRRRTQHPCAQ